MNSIESKDRCILRWSIDFLKKYIYLATAGLVCVMSDLVPWPGIKLRPLHWEDGVLAPGQPGKSWSIDFSK